MSSVSQFPPPHLIPDTGEERDTARETNADKTSILALPAPNDATDSALRLDENGKNEDGSVVKFDQLGPMIINTDGTISRVHNWNALTEGERERTYRLLVQRNKARMEKLKAQEENGDVKRE